MSKIIPLRSLHDLRAAVESLGEKLAGFEARLKGIQATMKAAGRSEDPERKGEVCDACKRVPLRRLRPRNSLRLLGAPGNRTVRRMRRADPAFRRNLEQGRGDLARHLVQGALADGKAGAEKEAPERSTGRIECDQN